MKAIFSGSISKGFGVATICADQEREDQVIRQLRDAGELVEAIEICDPSALRGKFVADPEGDELVVFSSGLGGGVEVYGPFDGDAEAFAERNADSSTSWDIFVVKDRCGEVQHVSERAN